MQLNHDAELDRAFLTASGRQLSRCTNTDSYNKLTDKVHADIYIQTDKKIQKTDAQTEK